MVAYSFKAQFAMPILDGVKGGTIRADRRRHARPGEELQLYTGMRTRQCRLIKRAECLAVDPIILSMNARRPFVALGDCTTVVEISGSRALDAFAQFDGFDDWAALIRFWQQEHATESFGGWNIRWLPLPRF